MGNIALISDPVTSPMSWEKFCKETPPYSISLDGYVNVGPRFDPTGPRANFNHHEEVDRLATRATCGQILMAIRQGLFATFRMNGTPTANVYVNDCDEDVCTSWFLLKHEHMVRNHSNPLLNRLVYMEDALDSTSGAYPFPLDLPMLEELAWVFEPYRRFRLNGGLEVKDSRAFKSVITDVEHRIMMHITGKGESAAIDPRYELVTGCIGNGWTMVREIGSHAKTGMFADGINAYITVRERTDGRYTYTLGRMSPFIAFDVPKIINMLNVAESIVTPLGDDKWGGGNTVGGSPRVLGSALSPVQVTDIVNSLVKEHHG